MIKSMTGFASLTDEAPEATIGVTIRAVNHRYLDLQLRVPSVIASFENRVRTLVQQRLGRGRVELMISLQLRQLPGVEVQVNEQLVEALSRALDSLRTRGLIDGALEPGALLRLPQAVTVREMEPAPDSEAIERLRDAVEKAVGRALDQLEEMRTREGDQLRADLRGRHDMLAGLIERVAEAAEAGRVGLEARLKERIGELAHDIQADPVAIAQEIVRFAARSDISEEIVRFRAHLGHWDALVASAEPCGRKLDFLLQEMNREVNTIGSKADGLGVSELIVTMKAELEKMREQVQNVE